MSGTCRIYSLAADECPLLNEDSAYARGVEVGYLWAQLLRKDSHTPDFSVSVHEDNLEQLKHMVAVLSEGLFMEWKVKEVLGGCDGWPLVTIGR